MVKSALAETSMQGSATEETEVPNQETKKRKIELAPLAGFMAAGYKPLLTQASGEEAAGGSVPTKANEPKELSLTGPDVRDSNPLSEAKQSVPTYTRSHLQVDEKDWADKKMAEDKRFLKSENGTKENPISACSHLQVDEKVWADKKMAEGNDLSKPENGTEDNPISPRSPDYDLFDGDERAREEFCKDAAKRMFQMMGW